MDITINGLDGDHAQILAMEALVSKQGFVCTQTVQKLPKEKTAQEER